MGTQDPTFSQGTHGHPVAPSRQLRSGCGTPGPAHLASRAPQAPADPQHPPANSRGCQPWGRRSWLKPSSSEALLSLQALPATTEPWAHQRDPQVLPSTPWRPLRAGPRPGDRGGAGPRRKALWGCEWGSFRLIRSHQPLRQNLQMLRVRPTEPQSYLVLGGRRTVWAWSQDSGGQYGPGTDSPGCPHGLILARTAEGGGNLCLVQPLLLHSPGILH